MFLTLLISLLLSFTFFQASYLSSGTKLPDQNDSLLITYIQNQVQNNLLNHKPLHLGLFFAPYQNTLAYSDLFLTSSVLTLPLRILNASPLLIYNANLIIGSILNLLSLYLLVKLLTKNSFLSLFTAILINYSYYHLAFLPHLQISNFYLGVFSLYLLLSKRTSLSLVFLGLQFLDSFFITYLFGFAWLAVYLSSFRFRPRSMIHDLRPLLLLPIFFPIFFPYLKLAREFPEAVRPIRDAAHFSLGLDEVFVRFFDPLLFTFIFLGLLVRTKAKKTFLWIGLFGLLLSLGPVLKFAGVSVKPFQSLGVGWPIPLPYSIFYYLFPGFTGFRTPSRWIILALLGFTIHAATKLAPVFKKTKLNQQLLLLGAIFIILAVRDKPKYFSFDPTPPAIYQQVKNLPEGSQIVELPIKLWNMENNEIESQRSIYSLYHGKRRLNGYSGFAPLAWIDLVNSLNSEGLNQKNVEHLTSLGITHYLENNELKPLK